MLLYSISVITTSTVILAVWLVVSSSGAKIPISYDGLVIYFLLSIVVKTITSAWFGQFLPYRIRSGKISPYLIKPMPYLLDIVANNFSEKLMKLVFVIPFVIGTMLILGVDAPSLSIGEWILFLITTINGAIIFFLFDFCLGLAAFWMEETKALQEASGLLESFFSGRIIPLIVMPSVFQKVGTILPFRYTLSLPVEIVLRQLDLRQLQQALMIQFVYVILAIAAYKILWKKGLRLYSSSGA